MFGIFQNFVRRLFRDLELFLHFRHLIQHPRQSFVRRIRSGFGVIGLADVQRGDSLGMQTQADTNRQLGVRTAPHRDQNLLRFVGNLSAYQSHVTGWRGEDVIYSDAQSPGMRFKLKKEKIRLFIL